LNVVEVFADALVAKGNITAVQLFSFVFACSIDTRACINVTNSYVFIAIGFRRHVATKAGTRVGGIDALAICTYGIGPAVRAVRFCKRAVTSVAGPIGCKGYDFIAVTNGRRCFSTVDTCAGVVLRCVGVKTSESHHATRVSSVYTGRFAAVAAVESTCFTVIARVAVTVANPCKVAAAIREGRIFNTATINAAKPFFAFRRGLAIVTIAVTACSRCAVANGSVSIAIIYRSLIALKTCAWVGDINTFCVGTQSGIAAVITVLRVIT